MPEWLVQGILPKLRLKGFDPKTSTEATDFGWSHQKKRNTPSHTHTHAHCANWLDKSATASNYNCHSSEKFARKKKLTYNKIDSNTPHDRHY